MRILLLILLATTLAYTRVVKVIDNRNFEFESYNFNISNNGSLFYLDSSQTGFYNKLDSMQYINDAGLVLTGYSASGKKVFLSNVAQISNAEILPGKLSDGLNINFSIDSTEKDKYGVYHSLDYDENGEPLFGEQIPNWPLYSQGREIDGKSRPMYIDRLDQRKSEGNYKPFYIGFEDIFTIYKIGVGKNFIQVENLVSLFENQILVSYKLINYGESIDSCLLSFYLDPDITHNKRIFQEIFNDEIELNNRPLIFNSLESSNATYGLSISTAHYPIIENMNIQDAFSDGDINEKYYVLSGYDMTQSADDLRSYQLKESKQVPSYLGDTRLMLNGDAFNFEEGDTLFVSYSIHLNELKADRNQNFSEIENQAQLSRQLFDNLLTNVAINPENIKMENFDIFDINGRLIIKNTNTINNLKNGKYILIDKNNKKTKKILIDR